MPSDTTAHIRIPGMAAPENDFDFVVIGPGSAAASGVLVLPKGYRVRVVEMGKR
jgi:hypothetical protein